MVAIASEVELARRVLLRSTVGTGLGIATLALPVAAVAASPDGAAASGQTLQTVTIDDTVPATVGHDVTLRIRLLRPGGTAFTAAATVSLTVTLDDGSTVGGHPEGLRIDGAIVDAESPTVTRSLTADDAGSFDVSIDVPTAGDYLVAITTDPTPLTNPGGLTLALSVS